MTRATNNLIWSVALMVGALVLAKKDEAAVPWALTAVAAIVGACAVLALLAENDKI